MSDKTFKQRVREEAENFRTIYEDFRDDYRAAKHEEQFQDDRWTYLFGVPFNGFELNAQPNDDAMRALKVPHRHDAVKAAIHELGIHDLRLGGLEIHDIRIATALDLGLATPNDLVPPSSKNPGEFGQLVTRKKLEYDDPFLYRALLEVLCRALVASKGPTPWPLARTIHLACDMDMIRRKLPHKRWNKKAVLKALQSEPLASKYPGSNSKNSQAGVGPDRVDEIVKLIGPMDDEALNRLKILFPEAFFKVIDQRLYDMRLQEYGGTTGILNLSEDIGEALSAATPLASNLPSSSDG